MTDALQRPLFHFTPPTAWINDPNGMVYLDGEYHLFYQYHPDSLLWGPMHWGHAVSRDLLRWEHLPIALWPDEQGTIFSGSAVIDRHNVAGFGVGALVAIFTQDRPGRQAQSLAFSTDHGRSWVKYAHNPVLLPPDGLVDFRDPKVFWYDTGAGGHWVMLLAVSQQVWLYTSSDLKAWTKTGEFGADHGSHAGVWECPDLQLLPVEGSTERHWVLFVGVQQGAPGGSSGTQYFLGQFDGAHFTCDDPPGTVRWADYGADFYAAQAWNDPPDDQPRWLAWMNNWDYARDTPVTSWRGSMSVPRELELAPADAGLTLVQRPTRELAALRGHGRTWHNLVLAGTMVLPEASGATLEILATFRADGAESFGVQVTLGDGTGTVVGYRPAQGELYVQRGGNGSNLPTFATPQVAPLTPRAGVVQLQILLDYGSVEVFADGGRVTLTNQIFAGPHDTGLAVFAEGGAAVLEALVVYPLGVRG